MPTFRPGAPSKLILEQDDMIYECVDPSITLTMDFNCVTIEARCWNLKTTLKEKMESETFVDAIRNLETKKKKKLGTCDNESRPHFKMEDGELCSDLCKNWVKESKKKVKSRKDRFPKDGGRPIKASVPGYSKIPWSKGTLTLIAQSPDGQLHYAKTMEEKKNLAWGNFNWIVVCWPGQYTQDIFLIDDLNEFRRALGFKPVAETVKPIVTDEDGNEWIYDFLFPPKTPAPKASAPTFYSDKFGNKF